jgi:hypothetical protein
MTKQAKAAHLSEHGVQRRPFPQEQFSWPVREHRGHQRCPLGLDG